MKRKVITILSILCIAALCIGTAVAISSSHKIKLNPDYIVVTYIMGGLSARMMNMSISPTPTTTVPFTACVLMNQT